MSPSVSLDLIIHPVLKSLGSSVVKSLTSDVAGMILFLPQTEDMQTLRQFVSSYQCNAEYALSTFEGMNVMKKFP